MAPVIYLEDGLLGSVQQYEFYGALVYHALRTWAADIFRALPVVEYQQAGWQVVVEYPIKFINPSWMLLCIDNEAFHKHQYVYFSFLALFSAVSARGDEAWYVSPGATWIPFLEPFQCHGR